MARAHAAAGGDDAARRYGALARETAARIADADDRALVVADLDSLP
jgi:hypothetical protein